MKKHKRISFIVFAAFIFSFILALTKGYACTGIRINTQDGNYIFGRTLEFDPQFMPHEIMVVPRNYEYVGQTPSGKPGMRWKVKYGYVGFNPSGISLVDDGINEKGLACGGFFFLQYAKFEDVAEKDYPNTISCMDLVSWILGNCENVAEIRKKLPKIRVCSVIMPELGFVPPVHCMAADKTGDAVIIEYVGGKLNIYDNAVNAIANAPDYPWHVTNVSNFTGLKPDINPPITINGKEYSQPSQGSGAFGLPGDFTSPSRFIRAMFFANAATQGKDVDDGINIAFHILNQFDIPKGSNKGMEPGGKKIDEATQWTSVSDLTNSRYFYHTYSDRTVRMIDLKKIDLNAKDIKSIKDLQKPGEIKDVSGQFK